MLDQVDLTTRCEFHLSYRWKCAQQKDQRISKQILDRINTKITNQLSLNQWKNTKAVLNQFNNIKQKDKQFFITFDVVNFYPPISIYLLNTALQFVLNYVIQSPKTNVISSCMLRNSTCSTMVSHGERRRIRSP